MTLFPSFNPFVQTIYLHGGTRIAIYSKDETYFYSSHKNLLSIFVYANRFNLKNPPLSLNSPLNPPISQTNEILRIPSLLQVSPNHSKTIHPIVQSPDSSRSSLAERRNRPLTSLARKKEPVEIVLIGTTYLIIAWGSGVEWNGGGKQSGHRIDTDSLLNRGHHDVRNRDNEMVDRSKFHTSIALCLQVSTASSSRIYESIYRSSSPVDKLLLFVSMHLTIVYSS